MNFEELEGSDNKRITKALISAFPKKKAFKKMLHQELGKMLDQIVSDGPLNDMIYELLIIAESENWVKDLLDGAYKANPNNIKLKELLGKNDIIEDVDFSSNEDPFIDVYEDAISNQIDLLLENIEQLYESLAQREPKYEWLNSSIADYGKIKNKWDDRRFQVSVIALMKSGKSTLLNSWMGYEFLPSSTVPETMRMIKIRHTPNVEHGELVKGEEVVAKGVEEINEYIHNLNKDERTNKKLGIEEIRLNVEFSTLKEKNLNGYGFDFLDTPGFNEFGISSLPAKVERLVKASDVIIYLLDITKLKSNDEKEMLDNLKQWKIDLFDKQGYRLFFVINKIDAINRHDRKNDLSVENVRFYVQDILSSSLDLNINEEHIIPISAELAILGRAVEKGIADDGQLRDFKEMAFGRRGSKRVTNEECKEAVPDILEDSGFTELENKVLETIYKNRSSILIDSVKSDLHQVLNHINNNLEVGKGALLSKIEDIKALKQRITVLQTELNSLNQEADQFKKKAIEIIDQKFSTFKSNLKASINDVFSRMAGTAPMYPWLKFFTDFTQMTVFELKDSNLQSFKSKIQKIHNITLSRIDLQFKNLVNDTIGEQYEDFINFRDYIEKKSIPLIRKIETEINETLKIELIPNRVFFTPPSLDHFFNDIGKYLGEIVYSETKSNMGFFKSLWNKFLKFFRLKHEEEQFYEEYKISSSKYRDFIFSILEPAIENSKEETMQHIESKYLATVNEATDKITNYANRYTQIIEKEIQNKKDGNFDIPLRIQNIKDDVADVSDIINALKAIE